MRAQLASAFLLLTRLPAGWVARGRPWPEAGTDVWAYPVVGAVIGSIGACAFALCRALGMHPALASIWTLVSLLLLTGALHEDGLADTADGFGGGPTPSRKLEIMRDSRIGSYGALALLLSTAARATALTLLAGPSLVAPALIASGALSRGAMAVPVLLLGPARRDGLAAQLGERRPGQGIACLLLAVAIPAFILPPTVAVVTTGLSAVAAFAVTALARHQVVGYTGDVLGTCAVVVDCAALSALASLAA